MGLFGQLEVACRNDEVMRDKGPIRRSDWRLNRREWKLVCQLAPIAPNLSPLSVPLLDCDWP